MHATDQLAGLIRRKHQVLVQLRDVARRQKILIHGGDVGSLLTVLAAKQHLIWALQELERDLSPHYAEDPERRLWRSAQERAACANQAAECNALLEEIVRMEKQGAEQMAMRRNEVAEQLQQVHASAQVRTAYEAHRRA